MPISRLFWNRFGPHFGSLFLAARRLDAFGRGRDLETAQAGVDESNEKTDLHVRLRTYTSSSYLCLEGLGCRVQADTLKSYFKVEFYPKP